MNSGNFLNHPNFFFTLLAYHWENFIAKIFKGEKTSLIYEPRGAVHLSASAVLIQMRA